MGKILVIANAPNISPAKHPINKNIKPIKNDGVAMAIIDDEELMITLIKSNTIMLVRDKPFIKIMKELFLNYYKNSKSQ